MCSKMLQVAPVDTTNPFQNTTPGCTYYPNGCDDDTVFGYSFAGNGPRRFSLSANAAQWTILEVFQRNTNTNGKKGLKRTQRVTLTKPEAALLFQYIDGQIWNLICEMQHLEHEELKIPPPLDIQAMTEEEDAKFFHKRWEISDNGSRKVVASYKMYNNKAIYFQVKLFIKDCDGIYRKKDCVSITMKELEQFANRLKEIVYYHYTA